MKTYITFLIIGICAFLGSCSNKTVVTETVATDTAVFATVVDYSELDGCTFLLELSDGQKLQPENLGEAFKKKGLKVFITYKIYNGISNCMAGKMVTLNSITVAKEDKR
ncbi:MAG: hypothetical protein M3Q95_01540 [Bacteroidota bacterium]|nr:hypothetical protein [Bacteroidota bacterium]